MVILLLFTIIMKCMPSFIAMVTFVVAHWVGQKIQDAGRLWRRHQLGKFWFEDFVFQIPFLEFWYVFN